MDEQLQAIRLLKEARSVLARRLAKRLLAERRDVMEDAAGESFMDEIDTIHDQIGRRLHRVNEMIEDLTTARADSAGAAPVLALPAPRPRNEMTVLTPVSLQTVVARLQSGKREEAARFLSSLFGLNQERGSTCADHFAAKVRQSPELLLKSMQLRAAVQACRYNHVLELLQECFGLRTVESMQVLRHLTYRFSRDDSTT